jgi:acetyl esterase
MTREYVESLNISKTSINLYQFIYLFMSNSLHIELEQNAQDFLDNLQQKVGLPIYTLSPDNAHAVLSGLQTSYPVQKLPADIENHTIPDGPDAKDMSITIVRPPNSSNETLPVGMFFHGGGWILGGFDTFDKLVRELANNANAAVACVNIKIESISQSISQMRKYD